MSQRIRTLHGLDQGWTQCTTLDEVLYQVLRISEKSSYESVCKPVVLPSTRLLNVLCVCFYQSALCRQCVLVLSGLRVCLKIKLN